MAQWLEGNEQKKAPSPNELKKQFNAIKYDQFPWMKDIHRDAHSQPFANLGKTVNQYVKSLKHHEEPHKPQFKKKGKSHDLNNRRKASMKVAKLHMRIAKIRSDFTHKTTTKLVSENQAIGIEDLNVSGMTKNHKLARALSDVGFGEFRRQIEYKAKLYDTTVVLADRFYPSSKKCSVCNDVLPKLELKTREWDCPKCGTHHDRDTNAARNLKRLATGTALPVASQPAMVGTSLRVSETLAMVGK